MPGQNVIADATVSHRLAASCVAALSPSIVARSSGEAEVACQDANECVFERLIENRVDDRVEHARRVSEPEEPVEEDAVDVARRANALGEVQAEEGRPADNEQQEHCPEDLDGLPLRLHGAQRVRWMVSVIVLRREQLCDADGGAVLPDEGPERRMGRAVACYVRFV